MIFSLLGTAEISKPVIPTLLAAVLGVCLSVSLNIAAASPDHDHGAHDAAQVSGNGPKRLPDGAVFLPKPAQRQIGARTTPVQAAELPRTIDLSGKVMMDPNAGGRIQSLQAGRLEAGPKGLPSVGQAVRKGEILGYVLPTIGALERSNQAALLAELGASRSLAEKRLARLSSLIDTVPRKDIEQAESELKSLGQRQAAISGAFSSKEALVAPVSGVIAVANAIAGQAVEARDVLFELVDPQRLRIEALSYDPELAADIAYAALAVGTSRVSLRFVGAARSLREQAQPLLFRAEGETLSSLSVGQPVRVFVQTASKVKGFSVPSSSLTKNPANQDIVWVKTAAERFEPRVVTFSPLDGVSVVVTSGLKEADRIVTQATALINQIR